MSIVSGRAQWYGSFKEGSGTLSTATTDTVAQAPYTFASRFEGAPGAIPEELLAEASGGRQTVGELSAFARQHGFHITSSTGGHHLGWAREATRGRQGPLRSTLAP